VADGSDQRPESAPDESGDAVGLRGASLVRWGVGFYVAMAGVALAWRTGIYGEPILYSGELAAQQGVDLLGDAGLGVLGGGVLLVLSQLATRATRWGEELARTLAEALGPISMPGALCLALVSGVAEEMLFRGALQPRVGLAIAGVLFGLVHFAPRRELLPWTAFAVLAGLLFGWMFEATGNLVAPIVAHIVVNGVNLPFLVRNYGSPDS